MKILFLGGSGFLGRRLIGALPAGLNAYAIARTRESADRIRAAAPAVAIVSADDALAIRFDRIINLVVDYGRGAAPLAQLVHTNLLYPLDLLERIRAEVVLNISTALPPAYSPYALSKSLLERSLAFLQAQTGDRFITVRLHNMYGPGAEQQEFLGFTLRRLLAGDAVEVSDCANSRDFIFVDDVVSALIQLCRHPERVSPDCLVELGTGRATCLRDVILMARELTGSTSDVRFGARPRNPFEPAVLQADMAAMRTLGWTPRIGLRDGIARTVASLDPSR